MNEETCLLNEYTLQSVTQTTFMNVKKHVLYK